MPEVSEMPLAAVRYNLAWHLWRLRRGQRELRRLRAKLAAARGPANEAGKSVTKRQVKVLLVQKQRSASVAAPRLPAIHRLRSGQPGCGRRGLGTYRDAFGLGGASWPTCT